MKTRILLFITLMAAFYMQAQNPPVTVNDTIQGLPGVDLYVNVLQNDYDPDGDSMYVVNAFGGYVVSDSVIHYPYDYTNLEDYYKGYRSYLYSISDTTPWYGSHDTGWVHIQFQDVSFYNTLDVNNVNAMFNCFGNHFWELPGGDGAKYFVPNGSTQISLFSNTLWIGGLDEDEELHLAAERYRQVGEDYFQGPVSNSYDSVYDAKWFRIWKLNKDEIEYHKNHWWQEEYEPIEDIAEWPGNGNPDLGQSEILAPYYDYDNDGTYDPLAGDWPVIKGDQALFFVFNDDRKEHTETEGLPLGIEVRAMAYAFNEPNDSALWNTTFLHYEIENKSDTTYTDTYIGSFTDIDLGNAWDDYIG